ncbi:hypothetical protein JCM13664_21740 [Methylothermus subterraneus]
MISRKAARIGLWILALGLLSAALFRPTWTLPQRLPRYLIVLDITQSMNARDCHLEGLPPDRLSFAKAALDAAIVALPCGAEVGLGVFTHKRVQLLLEPIETCQHAPALRAALRNIDWRNAWAADSYIAYGLFDALRLAAKLKTDLVFVTDGDQFPKTARDPLFSGRPAQVGGWLVGVGTPRPVPIPKLDLAEQTLGYWQMSDLPRPAESSRYPTQIPAERAELLLSHLDLTRLRRLAAVTDLAYLTLHTPQQLAEALRQPRSDWLRPVAVDARPWLGLGALLAVALAVLV